jgi:predicted metal-dependent phosphoesterase TrpH
LSAQEADAFQTRDVGLLSQIWPDLSAARRHRRARAATGRIDLHTHTTASDGEMTVEQLLCQHFVRGQILINDHNIIDSLPAARRLIAERDLELDVFLGIEVICTRERRAFEFQAIAPIYSEEFVALCLEHRQKWARACELFVAEFAQRQDMFADPLWRQIAEDHTVGGSFAPVIERYEIARERIVGDPKVYEVYLRNNQTFDMGSLWRTWELGRPGDPPMLSHRFFGSMRCYAMNAYRDELGNWFDYDLLAERFHRVGCFVSHNHPNYWDEDFIGELRHETQTDWIRDWAGRGVIDALEVWSPPFASKRVPDYWEGVCRELNLVPMAGTDCHSGREQEYGGKVENHPEIPPQIYAKLTAASIDRAKSEREPWLALTAWRKVLEIDYAQAEALDECISIARSLASQS